MLGIPDHTTGDSIALAGGGSYDLRADEILAEKLAACATHADMVATVIDVLGIPRCGDAYEQWERIEREAGDRAGDAVLARVDAHRGAPITGRRCLEAGGGAGRYVAGFARRFDEVVMIDVSLANLVMARQLALEEGHDRVSFIRADACSLPFDDGFFDFVHQNGVIEHVHDPVTMVRESLRVCRGTYFCLSPNRTPITTEPHFGIRLFGFVPRRFRHVDEHGTDLLTVRQLRRVFRSAGVKARPWFLPPSLPVIARSTPFRRLMQTILERPAIRRAALAVANGPALPLAPYHQVVVDQRGSM